MNWDFITLDIQTFGQYLKGARLHLHSNFISNLAQQVAKSIGTRYIVVQQSSLLILEP